MWKCTKCGEMHEPQFDTCWKCGTSKSGLADPKVTVAFERQKAGEAEVALAKEKLANIFLATGPISEPFRVLDVVFAIDSQEQGFFAEIMSKTTGFHVGANPSKAFDKVKLQLRAQCRELGGDAVINCQFEHRVAVANSLIPGMGGKQAVEIFAYGTVVKLAR